MKRGRVGVRPCVTRSIAASVISLSFCAYAHADQFQDGLAAAKKGNFAEADRMWHPRAELGDPASQLNVAILYRDGKGVPQNYATALWWINIAAHRNYPPAQRMLADMYATGQGVPIDKIRALVWYLVATSTPNGGDDEAKQNRDVVQSAMTVEEIRQANETAGRCLASMFNDCEPSVSVGDDTMLPIFSPIGSTPVPPIRMNSHALIPQDYPAVSIRLGEKGEIKVQYLIGIDGRVGACAVMRSSGHPRLDQSACNIPKRFIFQPAIESGKPTPVSMTATISFNLK